MSWPISHKDNFIIYQILMYVLNSYSYLKKTSELKPCWLDSMFSAVQWNSTIIKNSFTQGFFSFVSEVLEHERISFFKSPICHRPFI